MRVIGGRYRSRRLKTLPGLDVRPTPDRLREALFSILASRISGAVFVDAYAGCGSVGIEALSRGAARVIFIEKKRAAAAVIRENLRSLGVEEDFELISGSAISALQRVSGDIVFVDPPYAHDREYRGVLSALGGRTFPLVIVQHDRRRLLPEKAPGLCLQRVVRHGDNCLSFYGPVIE